MRPDRWEYIFPMPEGRALAEIHARFGPHFGLNLYDQSAREDEEGRRIAISLLAPHHQPQQVDLPARVRAKRIAGLMRMAAEKYDTLPAAGFRATADRRPW